MLERVQRAGGASESGSAYRPSEADRLYLQDGDTAPTLAATFHSEMKVFSNVYLAVTKFTVLRKVLGQSSHAVVVSEAVTY